MLKINDRYIVEKQDVNNLVIKALQTRSKRDGTTAKEWVVIGHYGTLKDVLFALYRKKIFNTVVGGEKSLLDVLQAIEKIEREFMEQMKELKAFVKGDYEDGKEN